MLKIYAVMATYYTKIPAMQWMGNFIPTVIHTIPALVHLEPLWVTESVVISLST